MFLLLIVFIVYFNIVKGQDPTRNIKSWYLAKVKNININKTIDDFTEFKKIIDNYSIRYENIMSQFYRDHLNDTAAYIMKKLEINRYVSICDTSNIFIFNVEKINRDMFCIYLKVSCYSKEGEQYKNYPIYRDLLFSFYKNKIVSMLVTNDFNETKDNRCYGDIKTLFSKKLKDKIILIKHKTTYRLKKYRICYPVLELNDHISNTFWKLDNDGNFIPVRLKDEEYPKEYRRFNRTCEILEEKY